VVEQSTRNGQVAGSIPA